MEEEKSCHPIPPLHNANSDIARSLRDIPPAHYTLKIESFSELAQLLLDAEVQNYESDIFEAGGYKWLNANGKVRRFHRMKTKWGFAQLLPLGTFNDAANGYLIHDTCVFGAEVLVINYNGRGECLTVLKGLDSTYTWKIDNFSSLDGKTHYSKVFTIGNRKWKLQLHPKGDSRANDKCLSLFLWLDDWETFPSYRKTYAKYKLLIRNQCQGQHVETTGESYISTIFLFIW
ncbi:hypothetical protein TEA_024925 [Camellia sinensis var. sinensis]|uniref:MATH domain-containing protein n=1 Tax=Camellia sinensis var. sinensis TaxID=542762 RepID=A0A4S4F1U3_CAMSN|nr:hypothetical protein TEA_024925 [Camellia sinensis var. sinensis]